MVAVNKHGKSVTVEPLNLKDAKAKSRHELGKMRKELRKEYNDRQKDLKNAYKAKSE
tara:strand:- start:347 stop:517 length:171 start_codon:yes stop_codon:yes gene_type:complete